MRGFYWTANSPYIQGMWVRARRAPRAPALSTNVADGFIDMTVNGRTFRNANPAFVIYECLTNTDWGMGGAPTEIDTQSFQAAAQLWRDENFGLFLLWTKQTTIEDFIGDVLDHVQAVLYLDVATGLLTIKPLRADYVIADLPVFDPSNCNVEDFDRRTWGETINEIVVSWTNPLNEQTETVTAQDLANIVQQNGAIVSQPRNYYGVRSAVKAAELAHRDLRTACAPLTTCVLKANRTAFSLSPGDCLLLNWPEEDAYGLVMRVQTVDYGTKSDSQITVTLIEDIFSLDTATYSGEAAGDPNQTRFPADPIDFALLLTAPAYVIANSADQFIDQPEYPEVNTLFLASDFNPDFQTFEPYTAVTLANGSSVIQSVGSSRQTPYALLPVALSPEAFTPIATFGPTLVRPPYLADLVFIGETEIALVQAVDANGYTLARGVLDTVPQAWPAGTPVRFINGNDIILDRTPRAPGETVNYRLLMRTSLGIEPYSEAGDEPITMDERPYRPLRPANVKVNGVGFGTAALGGGDATVTWSNRNRLLETSQILGWTSGSVPVEVGQTTTVQVLDASGNVLRNYVGLTGTSFGMPASDLVGGTRFKVFAERDGSTSLQSFTVAYTA